jgi:hypothetical protein
MKLVFALSGLAIAVTTYVAPLAAQDEARLRRALEGKRMTLKIDMPASQEGVDVFPGSSRPIDFPKLSGRLKKHGVAIKEGESAMITKVKVKDELIEIQLGGGGYGTSGDVLSGLVKNKGADSGSAQQMKIANERTARLAAGSRFNLRYKNGVSPEDVTPGAVVQALAEYGSIAGVAAAPEMSPPTAAAAAPATTGPNEVRKGLSAEEVQRTLGTPVSSSTSGQVTTVVYRAPSGSGTVEVDYYSGVAVDVRQRPAASSATIRKGMGVDEVERIAGRRLDTKRNGSVTTNKYHWQDGVLEADFVNGVLVSYRIVSN